MLLGIGNTTGNKMEPLSVSSHFEFIIASTSHLNHFFPAVPDALEWENSYPVAHIRNTGITLASLLLAFASKNHQGLSVLPVFNSQFSQCISLNLLYFKYYTSGLHHFTLR